MRRALLVASLALLASGGSAFAADCTKGLLWPYVRVNGDCLTDAEIAAGKSGVYTGPINTNIDVSAIKAADIPASVTTPSASATATAPAATGTPAVTNDGGALIPTSIFGGGPSTFRDADANCHKGILWPFNREPGDCLTADEKKEGKTGVYGGAAATPPVTQVSLTPAQSAMGPQAPAPVASCERSWLWPFVREAGDCPTGNEKKAGATTASLAPAAAPVSAMPAQPAAAAVANPQPPAPPPPAPPPPAPAPAASCERSWLWPFVRESGDCPTAAEKKTGAMSELRPAPAAPQVSAAPASAPQPQPAAQPVQVQAQAPAQNSSCEKSWLWPFVREAGDCPTAADKKTGTTSEIRPAPAAPQVSAAPAAAPQPQPLPVAQPMQAQAPAQSTSCERSWLWPFVRSDGECLTNAEKKAGETGVYGGAPAASPVVKVNATPADSRAAAQTAQVPQAPAQTNTQAPQASAASCEKGLLWPFVRSAGDCPTAAEKAAGK